MPIRPERAALYPGGSIRSAEWLAFRAFILFRAANRCEGTPQHPDCRAANGKTHPETGGRVVLTIAHMDHDETHADPARCRALCQRCHNAWDAPHRARTRRAALASGDLFGGAEFLCVQMQGDIPTVWALVDPSASLKTFRLGVYSTGQKISPAPGRYVGTFQMSEKDGGLVFHVFHSLTKDTPND